VLTREPGIDVADPILRGFVEILSGAECALAFARNDDRANCIVLVEFCQQGDQGLAHGDVDGIQYFRPVENDDRDRIPAVELDAVSHAGCLCAQT
jgi:hypothetical protein